MSKSIQQIRDSIDKVDNRILDLLKERSELVLDMRRVKNGKGIFKPSREVEIIRRVVSQNQSKFPDATIQAIFTEIVTGGRNLEENLKVAYLGPAGSYSHEAGVQLLGSQSTFMPQKSISRAVHSVTSGESDIAMLPYENSTEGTVAETLRLLADTTLTINGEISLPIVHCLIGRSDDYTSITEVTAHPQALGQCRLWLEENLPHAKQTPALSNSAAVQAVQNNPSVAAIASKSAAKLYNVPVISTHIQDMDGNTTRFITLGKTKAEATGADKTTTICTTHDTPGALHDLLGVFLTHGVNLLSLSSHPGPGGNYAFFIDFEGHLADPGAENLLKDLQQSAQSCKILGSYPKEIQ